MAKLTSVNLEKKAGMFNNVALNKWCEEIDEWLNENCEPETYFTNRFMRFQFKNPEDALAFKLRWA